MNHRVVAYINHFSKEYAITARTADYPLWDALDSGAYFAEFIRQNLAEGISKDQANAMKTVIREAYKMAGYQQRGLRWMVQNPFKDVDDDQ